VTLRSGSDEGPSPPGSMRRKQGWYVCMLRCTDGSYYVGVAQDVQRRLAVHNAGHGSVHTARRRPVQLVHWEFCGTKSAARTRENEIKGWRNSEEGGANQGRLTATGLGSWVPFAAPLGP
jgi:predicted GIY-YIG superfamily endonuclease